MKSSNAVVSLSSLVAVLALVAAGVGLFWQDRGDQYSHLTLRGQTVEIYGRGLYRHDSLFAGAANKGTDAVTLALGIPLLLASTLLYRRGSVRGRLLLMGALTWFLYVYASAALGAVAYNNMFLVYIVLFSASLFALVLAFRCFETPMLATRFSSSLPARGLAVFMFVSGALTLIVWLIDPVTALINDEPPESMKTQSTLFTSALDMAIIVPALFLAGALIVRHDPLGYLIAFPLLVLEAMLAPMITAQTISQVSAGWTFTTDEIVGPIAGFTILALVAIWFIVAILRNVVQTPFALNVRPSEKPLDLRPPTRSRAGV